VYAFLTFCLMCSGFYGCSQRYDIVIKSGKIFDGSEKNPVDADVGIMGERIVAIGKLSSKASRVIDVHNHAEFGNKNPKSVKNFLTQGVTTLVAGNCGYGEFRVAELFLRLERHGVGPNVIQLVGHNTIRELAMGGSFDRG